MPTNHRQQGVFGFLLLSRSGSKFCTHIAKPATNFPNKHQSPSPSASEILAKGNDYLELIPVKKTFKLTVNIKKDYLQKPLMAYHLSICFSESVPLKKMRS